MHRRYQIVLDLHVDRRYQKKSVPFRRPSVAFCNPIKAMGVTVKESNRY